jgi:hypothetical protein
MVTAVGLLAALLVSGCQRSIYDGTVQLNRLEVKDLTVDAPAREQKVAVEFSSPGVPIDICVALTKDQQAVKQKLMAGLPGTNTPALAAKQQAESGTLEATIPAGQEYVVMLSGAGKKAEVKVKINGK